MSLTIESALQYAKTVLGNDYCITNHGNKLVLSHKNNILTNNKLDIGSNSGTIHLYTNNPVFDVSMFIINKPDAYTINHDEIPIDHKDLKWERRSYGLRYTVKCKKDIFGKACTLIYKELQNPNDVYYYKISKNVTIDTLDIYLNTILVMNL